MRFGASRSIFTRSVAVDSDATTTWRVTGRDEPRAAHERKTGAIEPHHFADPVKAGSGGFTPSTSKSNMSSSRFAKA